jgi:hypothetical protein
MVDVAILDGRQLGEAERATSAVLDLLLAEIGTTFDRWVVLNAVVTGSVPADPRRDLETARRVLVEITREARAWLNSDRGVRFGK